MSDALNRDERPEDRARRPICRLDPVTIAQIAAGEVVERPGSVVRELVENSVDAGAGRIEVDFEQGGIELLRIVDDGQGIESGEIELALTSHATSKLSKSEDLERIDTLGFRGEALASIASVSRTILQSRAQGRDLGVQATCDGGILGPITPWTGPQGTRIEVRNLFHNTPARRKFLKAQSAETTYLMETMQRLMLALCRLGNRAPHLVVRNQGKVTLECPAGASLRERAEILWGVEVASDLLEVAAKSPGMRLFGVIGNNRIDRATTKFQHFLVNGRCIRDKSLSHALMEAYRGLIMVGRFPIGILALEIDPAQVDVNVHPAKAEVRFRDSQAVHHLVFKAVRERLRRENIHPTLTMDSPVPGLPSMAPATPFGLGAAAFAPVDFSLENRWMPPKGDTPSHIPQSDGIKKSEPPFGLEPSPGPAPHFEFPYPQQKRSVSESVSTAEKALPVSGSAAFPPTGPVAPLDEWVAPGERLAGSPPVSARELSAIGEGPNENLTQKVESKSGANPSKGGIGLPADLFSAQDSSGRFVQVFDSYLIVETDKGVMVIDQHALHERILYDQLKKKLESGNLPMQRLLLPEVVDFPSGQAQTVLDQKDSWQKLGFEIESFGGGAIAVGGFPVVLSGRSPGKVFRNLAEKLLQNDLLPTREEMLHSLMALLACHSAVRANERLTPPQMEALLEQRQLALDPNHCPHGRPTALLLSRQDLEKQFGRI